MGDFVIFGAGFVTFVTLPSPPPEECRFPFPHKKRYKFILITLPLSRLRRHESYLAGGRLLRQ